MKQSLFSNDPVYQPYAYNGLRGRYAHWPANSKDAKRTFVLVYGQHATLERVEPIAAALRNYGDVYVVDTPGFGGMESSYRLKQHPSLDFFAGHLKHFINEYVESGRELTFLGISYGFQVITTLLAKEQEIAKRTELAVSFVGFVKYTDFDMPLSYKLFLEYFLGNVGRSYPGSLFMRATIRPAILKLSYLISKPVNVKYKSLSKKEAKAYVDEQIWLWTINDHRTHAATAWDFWKHNDLTNLRINVACVHVGVPRDHLLKNSVVCEELKLMYTPITILDLNLANHAPIDVDSADKVLKLFPAILKTMFLSSNNKAAVLVGKTGSV